jgi:hypothetical protein
LLVAPKAANVPDDSRSGKGKATGPFKGLFALAKAAREESWRIFVLEINKSALAYSV